MKVEYLVANYKHKKGASIMDVILRAEDRDEAIERHKQLVSQNKGEYQILVDYQG